MKILVVGGGTAGHISPVLAVIASIRKLSPDSDILFVCSGKDYELRLLKEANISYKVIPSGKYRRYGRGGAREIADLKTQLHNIKDIGRVIKAYSLSRKIIKQFKPDVVFIKGGYVGLPVGLAAGRAKVPYVIHESDSIMGKTNRILSKHAKAVGVSFPTTLYPDIASSKLFFTGNPVRPEFTRLGPGRTRESSGQKPNILVFAGSQGAAEINENIFNNLELFTKNFNIMHIAGEQGEEKARYMRHRLPAELKKSYQPEGFLSKDMPAAYRWADVVVSRAGMNSLAELSAMSKPAIIIPLPTSTNDHQLKNAQYLSKHGAVRLLEQKDMEGLGLINEISRLIGDKKSLAYISDTIHKFFIPNSAEDLANIIVNTGKHSSPGAKA